MAASWLTLPGGSFVFLPPCTPCGGGAARAGARTATNGPMASQKELAALTEAAQLQGCPEVPTADGARDAAAEDML